VLGVQDNWWTTWGLSILLFIVGTLVIVILVFLIIRAFWLWYWKVNEQITLLEEIRDGIQSLRAPLAARASGGAPQSVSSYNASQPLGPVAPIPPSPQRQARQAEQ
jgi:hypothetical protein